jgi:2-keto-4-pentenoate hydratase/2-oxohepta-3-ene-1,7-dioic acid hydratase in catechol pathway
MWCRRCGDPAPALGLSFEERSMHIARVMAEGTPSYGAVDETAGVISLLAGRPFDEAGRAPTGAVVALAEAEFLVPVEPTKILAVGRNYAQHAAEIGLPIGPTPSVFMKPLQTLVPHGGAVVLPSESEHVEHEAEVAIVIGRTARNVPREDWADYVLGFTAADDVSARDIQKADPQLTRGKGYDTFCPLGPYIDTNFSRDEPIEVVGRVNGVEKQRDSTASLVFSIPFLIEWLSSWTTLVPGDVILTGSPGGTSRLAPGDVVEITVQGAGTLRHGVVASEGR